TPDGTIFSWNNGAEKMYGYKAEEVKGRSISIIIPPDQADELSSIFAKIKNGDRVEHFETVRVKKDGQHINVSLTVSPIKDNAGNIIGVSTIARDITERKRIEKELEAKMRTLERFQKITVGRELRMIELKAEIARLKSESGEKIN
ncbi:MAG: PAS domain S-box protein, partial [Candidatus Omnitrophica bacterium]|nr:PAS domain S-box protein [Candidatus Omnitrophota bacterium]